MCDAPPVEAVLQPFADGAEVSGVRHHSAVQRVVPQVYRRRERLGYLCGQTWHAGARSDSLPKRKEQTVIVRVAAHPV